MTATELNDRAHQLQRHRISAGAIVEHEGRLLMVRHVVPGKYDFWVAPGGGVKGSESYEEAAAREVWEETGLSVSVGSLLYVEDLINPECRFVKFWFAAQLVGGSISTSHPEAAAEHITEAAWLHPSELHGKVVFPTVLNQQYANDRDLGFPALVRLPLRTMEFW
ncbi:MAG: NUDIX hydrolase [Pseudomonadota bacterium]